jgi:uncharacterized ferritin-like protein (DUF455 family)
MSWDPFLVAPSGERPDLPRSLDTFEGMGDRLRSAAFAEIQARNAFRWAASRFPDAPEPLKRTWLSLADAEQKHLDWLLNRMAELKIEIRSRRVSDHLWFSLIACQTAKDFALYMASAEERGQRAGYRFYQALSKTDPTTAEIFRKIAEEETAHIALANRYFPE